MFQTFKIFVVLFFLCGICGQLSAQTFTVETVPNPKESPSSHYVSNPTGILSAASVARMDSILGLLEDSTTAQVAVVVLPSIGEAVPKDFAHELFNKWGVGRSQNDNGLLVLFVLDQRRVEMETGYGLEGVLPDITCGRIQREKMVPAFQSGDYNAGLLAGVEAIYETLEQPAAAQEVDAEQPYYDSNEFDVVDMGELFVMSFVLCFFLACLRFVRWMIRSFNPVKNQIDEVITKKKGHNWLGFFMYFAIPIWIATLLGLGHLYDLFEVTFGEALLVGYMYIGFIIWDSRARRMAVFSQLFGKMSEPEQYVRLQAETRFYWFDALFFPIPFLWLWYMKNGKLNRLRNHPRTSPEGYALFKVAMAQKAQFLTAYQKVEEDLKTVEYDIWRNEQHNFTEAIGYESLSRSKYTRCDDCHSKALAFEKEEVVKAATAEVEGRSKRHYECKACGAKSSKEFVIPIIKPVSSSSSGNNTWTSSGGSYSGGSSYSGGGSSSSWGGGRSGGGGAGSSW